MLIAMNPCKLKCLVFFMLLVLVAEETSLLLMVMVNNRSYQRLLQYPVPKAIIISKEDHLEKPGRLRRHLLPAAVLLLEPPALPWLLSLA